MKKARTCPKAFLMEEPLEVSEAAIDGQIELVKTGRETMKEYARDTDQRLS